MNATATATKFVAPEGHGVWNTEAEFVADFNRTMADAGISRRITSAADLNTMRVSVPARTDMPSKIDRDSLPQSNGSGNTNGSGKARANGATPKQLEWLVKMHNKKAENATVDAITARAVAEAYISFNDAQFALDYLFDRKVAYRKVAPVAIPVAPVETLTDGYYRKGDTFFKVQIAKHGSGNLYAKVFDTDTMSWEYAPGEIRKLTPADKLTAEQAGEFGKLYGRCIKCSRELTDEASIAAGIGPICAGKM